MVILSARVGEEVADDEPEQPEATRDGDEEQVEQDAQDAYAAAMSHENGSFQIDVHDGVAFRGAGKNDEKRIIWKLRSGRGIGALFSLEAM
jgi:hypothetical protein